MVEIGCKPILWHIMKIYSKYGFNEFVICAGYKSHYIKEYFMNYALQKSSVTFDFTDGTTKYHDSEIEPWKVTIVDTGLESMTGGRIKRIEKYINNETFMLTYGDGVADIDINALISAHRKSSKSVTLTAVKPVGRFGVIEIDPDDSITKFHEKPTDGGGWINGGFFVCEPDVFNLLKSDKDIWEKEPLEYLAHHNKLNSYKHIGFWRPMDTLKDKHDLNEMWDSGKPDWKIW
jgi:glucose-1-phosphate cytidylyltransferase